MITYIVVFLFTIVFTYFAQKSIEKSRFLFLFFSTCVLVIPSLFAAFRDITVGVDVRVYECYVFQQAKSVNSLSDLLSISKLEPFFVILNYISSLVSDKINFALFVIQFSVLFFAYVAIVRVRDIVPMWIMMLLFMLGYYNLSFNLMRQCIAITYIMFAYTYLLKDDRILKFILVGCVALFMHKTAVAPILGLSYIHWAVRRDNRKFYAAFMIVLLAILLVSLKMVLDMLASISPALEKYVAYGGDEGAKGGFKSGLITILWGGMLLCMILVAISNRYRVLSDNVLYCYFLVLCMDLACQFLGLYAGFATRLGMYFSALQVFYFPRFALTSRFNEKSNMIFRIMVIMIFVCVWLRMVNSTGNTIPYTSEILGI